MSSNDGTFTGSWILASVVKNAGTADETEEFVGRVIEGPNLSNEYETAETPFKGDGVVTRDRTHRSSDIEMTVGQEPGLPTLETLGLQDPTTKELTGPNEVSVMRVRYYYEEPDPQNPSQGLAQGKEFEKVEWAVSADNAEAAEHANHELTGFVNGAVYHEIRDGS